MVNPMSTNVIQRQIEVHLQFMVHPTPRQQNILIVPYIDIVVQLEVSRSIYSKLTTDLLYL